MTKVDSHLDQIADFETRRKGLVSQRAEADKRRRNNVVAAAAGDTAARKITDDSRRECDRIDGEIADLDEAIELAREALARAEDEARELEAEAGHAARLDEWNRTLTKRRAAVQKADKAARDLLAAFDALADADRVLTPLHRDIRVRSKHGIVALDRPYSIADSVHRWIATGNALGLQRYLRQLDLGAPNSADLDGFAAEDVKAIAKIEIADRPDNAHWTQPPQSVPNRGDGFGNVGAQR